MRTDTELQMDVQEELKWEPSVTASEIGVAVNDGVVTLSGTVPNYAEKWAAEKAARRVAGVKAIAEELEVQPFGAHKRSDTEIAEAAVRAIKWHVWVPTGIQATVENGWVTLRGEVNWEYQRQAAIDAVSYLPGVIGVSDEITIKPTVQAAPRLLQSSASRAVDCMTNTATIARVDTGHRVDNSTRVLFEFKRDHGRKYRWRAEACSGY